MTGELTAADALDLAQRQAREAQGLATFRMALLRDLVHGRAGALPAILAEVAAYDARERRAVTGQVGRDAALEAVALAAEREAA